MFEMNRQAPLETESTDGGVTSETGPAAHVVGSKFGSVVLALLVSHGAMAAPPGADGFKKLKGSEIRRAFVGHTFTDEVHFSFRYLPNGKLAVVSMGKKAERKWRIVRDELCATEDVGETCSEVWVKGNAVSLRPQNGALSVDGALK